MTADGRLEQLQLRVPLRQLVALHHAGQVRLVGDVEEDLQAADRKPTTYSCEHRQPAADERDRDRGQQHGAAEVGADEDRPAPHPIDPDAGGNGEQDERQELERAEDADLDGDAPRVMIATSGSASCVISSPNWLMVWATTAS